MLIQSNYVGIKMSRVFYSMLRPSSILSSETRGFPPALKLPTFSELKQPCRYLGGGASTGSTRGFPGPLPGNAVDIVVSPCGRV